jgi:hypothetical protein
MANEKTKRGLEALAGNMPRRPAKASSPADLVTCHDDRLKPLVQPMKNQAWTGGFSR